MKQLASVCAVTASRGRNDATARLARADHGTIFLLHVLTDDNQDRPEQQRAEELARRALDEMARVNLNLEIPRELLVGVGDPATVIVDFEQVIPADLVVMRAHARVSRLRKALGGVTERVVRESLCPVLLVAQAT
jgi:nucleotide-binding universal stress UspA family protein